MAGALEGASAGRAEATQPSGDLTGLLPGGLDSGDAGTEFFLSGAARARAEALTAYWRGLSAESRGNLDEARRQHLEALRLDPGHLRLAARLAAWHAVEGEWEEALALLEMAAQAVPDRPDGLLALSEFCARYQDRRPDLAEQALATAEAAVARFPSHAVVHGHLIKLHWRRGAREAAAAALEQAAARPEQDPRYWLGLAGAALPVWPPAEPGNRDTLLALFRRARALAPDDPSVAEPLADFLALYGGLDEASALYQELVTRRPEHLKAREKLARTLALTDRRAEAVEVWQKILGIDPQNETAHLALARHLSQAGDPASSLRHRAEALRWGRGESLRDALRLVRDMFAADQPRQALPVLERAEFKAPGSPEPPYLAALAHRALGDPPRALAAFARAAAVAEATDPQTSAAFLGEGFFFDWATTASLAGQIDEAEKKFRESIARVPPQSPERAAKSYNGLAYLWLENDRNVGEAGPLVERALKLDPGNPAYLDTLGWFHFKRGEYDQSLAALGQAESASPQPVAEIIDHRAQALWALGRQAEARTALQQAVALPDSTATMRQRLEGWRATPPAPPKPGPPAAAIK